MSLNPKLIFITIGLLCPSLLIGEEVSSVEGVSYVTRPQASLDLMLLFFFSLETFMTIKTQEEFQLWWFCKEGNFDL